MEGTHNYFVRAPGSDAPAVLVHNLCNLLSGSKALNRGSRNFTSDQGSSRRGWQHIWERHGNSGNANYVNKTQFSSGASQDDVLGVLGKTLK